MSAAAPVSSCARLGPANSAARFESDHGGLLAIDTDGFVWIRPPSGTRWLLLNGPAPMPPASGAPDAADQEAGPVPGDASPFTGVVVGILPLEASRGRH